MGSYGVQLFTLRQCSAFTATGLGKKPPQILKSNNKQRMQLCDSSLVISRRPIYNITPHL